FACTARAKSGQRRRTTRPISWARPPRATKRRGAAVAAPNNALAEAICNGRDAVAQERNRSFSSGPANGRASAALGCWAAHFSVSNMPRATLLFVIPPTTCVADASRAPAKPRTWRGTPKTSLADAARHVAHTVEIATQRATQPRCQRAKVLLAL